MYNTFATQGPFYLPNLHPFEDSLLALALIAVLLAVAAVIVKVITRIVVNAPHRPRVLFCSAIAFQFAALAAMAAPHAYTLTTGREITLRSEPIDPYALFRGDYVTLSYAFAPATGLADGQNAWVILSEHQGIWKSDSVVANEPRQVKPGQIAIAGKVEYSRIRCGIEQAYVPEGTGRELEKEKYLKVKVAVDNFGHAVVKSVTKP